MKKILAAAVLLLAPAVGFAQFNSTGLETTVGGLTRVVNMLIPFFLAVAVVVFIYGVIKYIIIADADARKSARDYIIYGVVGITVILAVWGLARLLINTFGLQPQQLNSNEIPTVPSSVPLQN